MDRDEREGAQVGQEFSNFPDGRSTMHNSSQQAIGAKCFHPSGAFKEFPREDVEQSIFARFEKIVRQFPDRIAFKTRNEILSYSELNAMANRVAHALLERQGPKAQLVGILMEKDVPQLAAMLGVMKAGKFFLILDLLFENPTIAGLIAQIVKAPDANSYCIR